MSTMKAIVAGLVLLVGLGYFFVKDGKYGEVINNLLGGSNAKKLDTNNDLPPVERSGDAIRIASFNIQVFGDSKSNKPQVMNRLAEICREFDIVAIQEIRSKNQDLLPNFVELVNESGRKYDYVIGERPWPCRRRASCSVRTSEDTGTPAGRPSRVATSAGPWDSPAVRSLRRTSGPSVRVRGA